MLTEDIEPFSSQRGSHGLLLASQDTVSPCPPRESEVHLVTQRSKAISSARSFLPSGPLNIEKLEIFLLYCLS